MLYINLTKGEGLQDEGLGHIIKRLREAKGLSQVDLAKLSGINRAYISQLESGKITNPTRKTAEKLATALEVPPETLFQTESVSPSRDIILLINELKAAVEAATLFRVPVMGTCPGGPLEDRQQEVTDFAPVPKQMLSGVLHPYGLRLKGDSCQGFGLHDGELLIVDPDAEFTDGRIYIVRIGNEVTCKKLYREDNRLRLVGSSGEIEIMAPARVENLGRVILSGHWTVV